MQDKPALLFVSPALPAIGGHGPAMRAHAVLETLADDFRVHLLVLEMYRSRACNSDPEGLAELCARTSVHSRGALNSHEAALAAAGSFSEIAFEVVHVFRLAMAPFAQIYLHGGRSPRPVCCIDLDDFESETHSSIARLAAANGDSSRASAEETASRRSCQMERVCLPAFDRIYVSNPADQLELARQYRYREVRTIPNVVRMPAASPHQGRSGARFTFMFAGTMDYYPNEDAVRFFCRAVLPELRQRTTMPFRLMIVGPAQRGQCWSCRRIRKCS